jgi:hypothetical protein
MSFFFCANRPAQRSGAGDSHASSSAAVAQQPTIGVLDLHVPLEQAPELERTEVHISDAVVDLFKAHILGGAHSREVHPTAPPANAAIAAYQADFEAIRI